MASTTENELWRTSVDELAEDEAFNARLQVLHSAYRAGAIALMNTRGYSRISQRKYVSWDVELVPWLTHETKTHHQSLPIEITDDENSHELVIGRVSEKHRGGPLGLSHPAFKWENEEFYIRDITSAPDPRPILSRSNYAFGSELTDRLRLPYNGAGLSREWHYAEAFAISLPVLAEAIGVELPRSANEFAVKLDN